MEIGKTVTVVRVEIVKSGFNFYSDAGECVSVSEDDLLGGSLIGSLVNSSNLQLHRYTVKHYGLMPYGGV